MDMIEFHDEESGGIVYIQAPTNGGWRDINSEEEKKTLTGKLKDSLQSLRLFGKGVMESVADLKPDEVEVKVGLTLKVSEGKLIGLLAKAGAETSFEVTLKWTNKEDSKPGQPKV